MATLRTALPGTGYDATSEQGTDLSGRGQSATTRMDDSSRSHRQLIGWIGLLLPILLWAFAGARPNDAASAWNALDSISAYFYTSAAFRIRRDARALSLYLYAYRGFRNSWQVWDKCVARTAATAALVVAAFPTFAPSELLRVPWWRDWFATAHYAAAALLFRELRGLFLVPVYAERSSGADAPTSMAATAVYYASGVAILASMAWAAGGGPQESTDLLARVGPHWSHSRRHGS